MDTQNENGKAGDVIRPQGPPPPPAEPAQSAAPQAPPAPESLHAAEPAPEHSASDISSPILASPPQPKKRSKKNPVILVIIIVLLLAAAGWYMFIRPQNPTAVSNGNNSAAATSSPKSFVPRFSHVFAVAQFGGSKWYAVMGGVAKITGKQVVFLSNAQGVPTGTPNSLVIHDNRLWVATLNGVAYLDKSGQKFVTSTVDDEPNGLQNSAMIADAGDNKLYLSTFNSFYVYNDKTSKWESQAGPKNVQSAAINDKFLAVYVAAGPDWPIMVYDKTAHTWVKNSPAIEEQMSRLVAIDKQIFLVGRPKGYLNCDNAGKIAATAAFRLDEHGVWQPMTEFNKDVARPELSLQPDASLSGKAIVESSPCGSSKTAKLYTLAYDGKTLQLKNEQAVPDPGSPVSTRSDEQAKVITEIMKASGMHPSMQVADIDGKGNIIFRYSDAESSSSGQIFSSVAVAKQTDFSQPTELKMDELKKNESYPILCGSGEKRALQYVFSGTLEYAQAAQEGFPSGYWKSSTLYKIDGAKLAKVADLGSDVSTPVFACDNSHITWLGKTGLRQLDRASNAIKLVGAAISKGIQFNQSAAAVTPTGNLWYSIDGQDVNSSSLYFYDAVKNTSNPVAVKINVTSLDAASDTHVVVSTGQGKNPEQFMYDTAGKAIPAVGALAPAAYLPKDDSFLFVKNADSITTPVAYTINLLKAGANLQEQKVTNTGYTARSETQAAGFFGLFQNPVAVYDAQRSQLWLNDDTYGVNALALPR
jgi:hypothetical protein